MTTELLADRRRRERLAKIKERRVDYKKLRNEIVSKTRKLRKEYTDRRIKESIGNMKMHWRMVREATDKTNNKEDTTTSFHYEGRWVENPQDNAENFNKYLANIGKETNQNVGNPKHHAQHYLSKHSQTNQNSLLLSDVSSQDVLDACTKFSPKTSTDPNGFQQSIVLQDID